MGAVKAWRKTNTVRMTFSWTRPLMASVSRKNVELKRNSIKLLGMVVNVVSWIRIVCKKLAQDVFRHNGFVNRRSSRN